MSCYTQTKSVQSNCNSIKKVGGLDKRIYIGNVNDLAGVTFGAAGINSVTAFAFKTDKGFTRWVGKKDKNNAGSDSARGENITPRNHSVNLSVYYETAADLLAIDELIDTEGAFAVVETNAGVLEVYGINKINFRNYGLVITASPHNTGTVLQDSTAFALTLSGELTNLQLIYNPAASLDTNITALDTLSIDADPVTD